MTSSEIRPILALSMGDPVGVGPEIIVKALADAQIYQVCRPLVLGDYPALERARLSLDPALTIHLAESPEAGRYKPGTIDLLPLSQLKAEDLEYARPTQASGKAMVSYILKAIELAQERQVAGVVTGPISKLSMNLAGYQYPGHTELLADKTGTPEVAMMLAGEEFRVVLATIHCALAEVPGRLSIEGLFRLFNLTCQALARDFGLADAPLAVAALNPHAGEGGMFGREEKEIIVPRCGRPRPPACRWMAPSRRIPCSGGTIRANSPRSSACTHDQGLIPLKLLHFMDGVNVTLGLPIIRTSVDHGTAYDLAGTGKAISLSLKAALRMAAAMAVRRFGQE